MPESLRILLLTYQGDMAGSTHSIAMLADGLAQRGHKVWVGCRKESLLYNLLQGSEAKLIPMQFKGKFDLANMRQIRDAVLDHGIQIINAQSSIDRYTSIFARYFFKLSAKVIHTRRQRPLSVGGLQNWLYNRGADGFVAVSSGVADALKKLGLDEHKIKVIYNGTPAEKYQYRDEVKIAALKEKFQISESDFVIGCVSRRKQQEQILKALAHIDIPIKLIFVGINESPDLNTLLVELPKQHKVFFEGEVNSADVLSYYPIFSIKVLASNMEGLSQSLLEAMALGIPVVATNAAGNPDLVQHEVNGLLFGDGDIEALSAAIIRLKSDPNFAKILRNQGKKTALETFSLQNTILGYEEYFHQLLKNS